MKKRLLFVITQFYKGGAETSLLNLFRVLDPNQYDVDFLVLNQLDYPDVTSLMGAVPDWIHVYDVVKQGTGGQFFKRVQGKICRSFFHMEPYFFSAGNLIKQNNYDAAFSFGEWLSPAFVAKKVNSERKYVWIHIDIDKADFVNKAELVKYDEEIDGYLFVSEHSRSSAASCCPQMMKKSYVVHNFLDCEDIRRRSEDPLPASFQNLDPYLLSVGNLRVEKNYPRQLEVLKLLKQRGQAVKWLCVGSTANKAVLDEVQKLRERYALEDDFIICGADNNPYKYMKHAAAVTVLSDHESWSLVISEAKLLGIPVIATDTSGAREQLVDGETGVIVDFEPEHMADKIQAFLLDEEQQLRMRENLKQDQSMQKGLPEFEDLLGR